MADFTFTGDVGPIQSAAPFGNFRNVNNRYLNLAKQFKISVKTFKILFNKFKISAQTFAAFSYYL